MSYLFGREFPRALLLLSTQKALSSAPALPRARVIAEALAGGSGTVRFSTGDLNSSPMLTHRSLSVDDRQLPDAHRMRNVTLEDLRQFGLSRLARLGHRMVAGECGEISRCVFLRGKSGRSQTRFPLLDLDNRSLRFLNGVLRSDSRSARRPTDVGCANVRRLRPPAISAASPNAGVHAPAWSRSRDSSRVNVQEAHEVEYWTHALSVTCPVPGSGEEGRCLGGGGPKETGK